MSSSMRESSHMTRKYMTHSNTISGQGHSINSTNSLENNLDALLEDLQTSVSRSATPSGRRPISPQVEYRTAANSSKFITESRSISPHRTTTTTREKYITGPGMTNGITSSSIIPSNLETLDSELRNVQPGQSKTVAYKQVSYQYSRDGKPIDSFTASDNLVSSSASPLSDNIHSINYEESNRRHISPDRNAKVSKVNRELVFGDKQSTQSKEVKVIRETNYNQEPKTVTSNYQTRGRVQEYGVEPIPIPSPSPSIPLNLAPGPNTKVTTTIKTYTYELPGSPDQYLPSGHTGTDQTVTYTIDKTLDRSATPIKYTSTPDINQKSSYLQKESKFYREELHDSPTFGKPNGTYHPPSSPTNYETTTTKKENFYIRDEKYENGYIPGDRVDHPGYPNPPYTETTTTTLIDRIEEHYPDKIPSPTHNYYSSSPQTTSNVYKYSKESYSNGHPSEREVLLPKPFPTGTQMYPVNGKGPGDGPPARLDDLMASFSESERQMLLNSEKGEYVQRKEKLKNEQVPKKEVEFINHTPPKVQSKNIAGPPVYYPPGSAEFTKKEEGAMMQASGEWAKARGQYEYEASSKSKTKQSSGKAVVPVCLPLCCALPCTIM